MKSQNHQYSVVEKMKINLLIIKGKVGCQIRWEQRAFRNVMLEMLEEPRRKEQYSGASRPEHWAVVIVGMANQLYLCSFR